VKIKKELIVALFLISKTIFLTTFLKKEKQICLLPKKGRKRVKSEQAK